MTFVETLEQVRDLLRGKGRISYRALKRQFALDDDYVEDLKAELIDAEQVATDEDGKVLVWTGGEGTGERANGRIGAPKTSPPHPTPHVQSPATYTPAHLAERIRAVALPEGERKIITAVFADLKGSTALIEGLDPEDARAIIDPALQLMMDAVHGYDGYVAQALGDGIFALFGAPLAHEDHPQRALYAALRMQDEMRRYADRLREQGYPPLLMRVGVNTGEVVVRSIRKEDLHTDYVPIGHSTNLAARMEQLAAPGSILVTAHTHTLTTGYFEFKPLGKTQIKGVEEPLNVYEVVGVGPLRTRLQIAARRGLTRFVGRHSEMTQIKLALEQAKAGHGQIVGVMGDPGMGKSRLFHEFKLTSQSGVLVLEAFSLSHGKAAAYLPVIELLKNYFDITVDDDERKRQEKVTGKVLRLDRSLEDTLPYLFALLGIEEQPSPLQQMDAQIRRRRTFEALKRLFLRESLNQPLILIFEDLHWIDSETQGFLDVLSESVASAKLLLLTNYRPEYRHDWGQKTYYTQLRLAPFGKAEAEEFLEELLGEKSPLPAGERARVRGLESNLYALKQLILDKTHGTPFFMEESVQELKEQGVLRHEAAGGWVVTHPTMALQMPTTVQSVLAARIDRLAPDEKALLQQLAVIGREFPLSLVRHVITQSEADLYRLLASLQHKEFLYEQPAFPEVEYIFKHALTQDVAYSTVLQERRKALHEKTARAIESLYSTKLEDHYNDLAHHYSRSGNTEKAIEYLHKAGQQAGQRSANAEAIVHLTAALEMLKTLPKTPKRDRQELAVLVALGMPLQITRGYYDREAEKAYVRARELCQQLGETSQLSSVLFGLWVFYLVRAELLTSREFGEELLAIGENVHEPALLAEAHFTLADTLFHLGNFLSARKHAEQGLSFYGLRQHQASDFPSGHEVGVLCHVYRNWALWTLGYPDQALKGVQAAIDLAQKAAHPLSLAIALDFATIVHYLRQDKHAARETAEAAIILCSEYGFSYWLAFGTVVRGWILFDDGQKEEGIAQIRQGVAMFQVNGELDLPYWLALLAEVYGRVGQVDEGLAFLAEAHGKVRVAGERFEAELHRLKGELTLQQLKMKNGELKIADPRPLTPDAQGEVETCFLKAIEIAQKQQAKSLELRAATSLARLWQQQGRKDEARQRLAEIYGWFTEGFDAKDLQEARALLETLA